jgi:hypothetical protein
MHNLRFLILAISFLLPISTQAAKAAECKPGRISCEAWCKKYREPQNQESCLRINARSCIKLFGSVDVCVPTMRRENKRLVEAVSFGGLIHFKPSERCLFSEQSGHQAINGRAWCVVTMAPGGLDGSQSLD